MIRARISRRKTRWPLCGAWEMDALYHGLRACVVELEDAWQNGSLRERLGDPDVLVRIGPDLLAAYVELATATRSGDANARRAVVHALLGQLRDEVFSVERWGTVRGPVMLGGRPLDTTIGDGPSVQQRVDQIAARRFWGLGFVHEDDLEATDELARKCVHRGVKRFARDLRDLARVLGRSRDGTSLHVPSHAERRFEQLMLDVLDENHRRARAARLVEDFCQKTDLRVHYPGLDRDHGARVQIKSTAHPGTHESRIASIRNRDTLVILSPVTLAEFIDEQQRMRAVDRQLTGDELTAFWRCVPGQPVEIGELAFAIRDVLFAAMDTPAADPRGPLAAVPDALRTVIRKYVRDRAFRSTNALRMWEASHGRPGSERRRRPAPRETGTARDGHAG